MSMSSMKKVSASTMTGSLSASMLQHVFSLAHIVYNQGFL